MATKKTFGTFAGVFTPTTLTILGVIMYIRQPWVVGNAGILGALAIVLLSVTITLATALSISSITTNVKIGSGGAFSVISQSLGLEIGGAIGIPFYIAQAIAVAMYIFGFREGLQTLLPDVLPIILDISTFVLVMAIAFISTSFAFKIQYVILAIIFFSILSILGGLFTNELDYSFEWIGTFPGSKENNFSGSSFWLVFAVFFPAVTGVMAGANMSGDLTNPRKSIPNGTLSAVVLTTIIYIGLIVVAALLGSPKELVENYNIFIDKAFFPPIVLAGLLGATLSSALGSFVGAPRILSALGEKQILPKSNFIAKTSKKGEPVNAMFITAIIVLIGISLRDLNTIAPLLTMFFMITYAMVNIVALVEQSLSLPSYRPSLKIPLIVPIIGAFGSVVVMFIMNAVVALVSLVLIISFYFYLVKKNFKSEAGDSRSGLFTALAEWATKKTVKLSPKREARSWRPDLLIPVTAPKDVRASFKLIESIVYPKGSIKFITLKNENDFENQRLNEFIPGMVKKFEELNVPVAKTNLETNSYNEGLNLAMQSLNAAFFKPNTLFIGIDDVINLDVKLYNELILNARRNGYGLYIYIPYKSSNLSVEKNITLWIDSIPKNWYEQFTLGNNDLSILTAILIAKNWNGNIKINIKKELFTNEMENVFSEMTRFPKETIIEHYDNINEKLKKEILTDLCIFGIEYNETINEMIEKVNTSRVSSLFCLDSNNENAIA